MFTIRYILLWIFLVTITCINAGHFRKVKLHWDGLEVNATDYHARGMETVWLCAAVPIESTKPEQIIDIKMKWDDRFMQVGSYIAWPGPVDPYSFPGNGEKFKGIESGRCGASLENSLFLASVNGPTKKNGPNIPYDAGYNIGTQTPYEYIVADIGFNVSGLLEYGITAEDFKGKGITFTLSDEIRPKSLVLVATGVLPGIGVDQYNIPANTYEPYVENYVKNPSPDTILCNPFLPSGVPEWFTIYNITEPLNIVSWSADNGKYGTSSSLYIIKVDNTTTTKLTAEKPGPDAKKKDGGWVNSEDDSVVLEITDELITQCRFDNRGKEIPIFLRDDLSFPASIDKEHWCNMYVIASTTSSNAKTGIPFLPLVDIYETYAKIAPGILVNTFIPFVPNCTTY